MNFLIRLSRPESKLVGHESMHPIDGNEFFGQGKRRAELICFRTGNARQDVAFAKASQSFGDVLSCNAPPSTFHRELDCWMPQNGGSPFDRVDLGKNRSVDQPGSEIQIL